ncbi:MAG TPA: hypothetical protein VKY37_07880, partial [Brumimicrobium sp.]|nr:hypothetical protein [Brumimicrobium sp.]
FSSTIGYIDGNNYSRRHSKGVYSCNRQARSDIKKSFNLGVRESCRISYEDYLSRSFDVFGLGEVDFKQHSFAEKNFHCGYYAVGDELNDILDFRRDDLDDLFQKMLI